jgi:carbonic anhydrase
MGSLTTPPCSEIVSWFVLKNSVTASDQQVAKFSKLIGENARPVQAQDRRFVLKND